MSTDAATRATITRAWMAWIAVCLIWGTTYLGIKIALDTIPPFLMGGLRYTIAGLLLAAVLRARGRTLPPFSEWGRLVVVGFFMLTLGNGGVVWAEQSVPSGLTAVLIGTSPFWMVGVDTLLTRGRHADARQWLGLTVGFIGIVILVWPQMTEGGEHGRNFGWGVFAVQVACAGWAVGSAYTRRYVKPRDILGSAALQMTFGGLIMIVAGTALGEWSRLSFTMTTGAVFAYLTIAGSVIAFAAYWSALKHLDVAVVSLYTYVNPIIAVILGTLLLDEPFHMRMLIAAGVILAGMAIVGVGSRKS